MEYCLIYIYILMIHFNTKNIFYLFKQFCIICEKYPNDKQTLLEYFYNILWIFCDI